jgi:hypothetical protein
MNEKGLTLEIHNERKKEKYYKDRPLYIWGRRSSVNVLKAWGRGEIATDRCDKLLFEDD